MGETESEFSFDHILNQITLIALFNFPILLVFNLPTFSHPCPKYNLHIIRHVIICKL